MRNSEMRPGFRFVRPGAWVAALLLGAGSAGGTEVQVQEAQARQQQDAAAVSGLVVPAPDLSALESAVAEQLRQARDQVRAALAGSREDPGRTAELMGELARMYLAYELYDAAEPLFRQGTALTPDDFRFPYHLAYTHEQQGRLFEAAAGYERVREMRPRFVPAQIRLARVYRRMNELERADALVQNAVVDRLRDQPELLALLAERGELRAAQGRHEEASRDLDQVLQAAPAATRLHYPLAMSYRALGEMDRAREHLARRGVVGLRFPDPMLDSIELLTRGERVHLLRGQMAYRAGDYAAAAEAFEKAVAASPDQARGRVNLATTRAAMGDRDAAMREFEQVVALEPDNFTGHYNLGLLLVEEERWEEAIVRLQTALDLDPADYQARLALAQALQRTGQLEPASQHYRRIASEHPQVVEAWLGGAGILLHQERYADARRVLEMAHQALPGDGPIAHLLARLLAGSPDLSLRDGARALDLAERVFAARNTPDHAVTLAMALAENGRCEAAAGVQRQVLEAAGDTLTPAQVERLAETLRHYEEHRPCR